MDSEARENGLEVSFEPPSAGWITIRLTTATGSFVDSFSHIYASLKNLCLALADLGQGLDARPVVFLLEPVELELRFSSEDASNSVLTALVFPDYRRTIAARPTLLLTHSANTREIILKFWRALRRLQTCLSPEAFAREWREAFPTLAMSALTVLITSWKERGNDVDAS